MPRPALPVNGGAASAPLKGRGERVYRPHVMADEPDNLVLHMLRRMDVKLDRLIDDVYDLKVRMTHVEEGLAGIHRRMDRLEVRVDRIERRLELADEPR